MYRIKIEERNNGEIWYIPQFGVKKSIFGLFSSEKWENIIISSASYPKTSSSLEYSYKDEEGALNSIEEHKKWIEGEKGKSTKGIVYKMVEL